MLALVGMALSLVVVSQTPEEAPAPEEKPAETQTSVKPAPAAAVPKPHHRAAPPSPALDEGAKADAPVPAAPPHLAPSGPVAPGAQDDEDQASKVARSFFVDLIQSDARRLVADDCGLPFYVEDRKVSGNDELFQEWLKNLRDKRTDLLTLYSLEVLSPQEMERRYGKPPARLSSWCRSRLAVGAWSATTTDECHRAARTNSPSRASPASITCREVAKLKRKWPSAPNGSPGTAASRKSSSRMRES
jgi:hypothetical protein